MTPTGVIEIAGIRAGGDPGNCYHAGEEQRTQRDPCSPSALSE